MRAITLTQFGNPEVLKDDQLPDPVPGAEDLKIEVHATSVNPIDFKIRRGAFREGRQFPFTLGYDVSGVVVEKGKKVSGFNLGDEVYASPCLVRNGANAEYVCVDARTASLRPTSIDHIHCGVLPLVTLTAWEALYERANIHAGQRVLIQGGAGGVGHVGIQLAKLRGCQVLCTASRDQSIRLCKELGADLVINYKEEDFVKRVKAETEDNGCDVIFDCVGGEVFDRSARCVSVNGQIVTCVGAGNSDVLRELFVRNATLHFEMMAAPTMYGIRPEKQGQILRDAAALVDQGRLRAHVSQEIDLADVAEGHRLQEAGHCVGKIAVRVKEPADQRL